MSHPRNRRSRRTKLKNKACTYKKTYPNIMAALHAAVRTNMTWYKCKYCHKFHLTSNREILKSFSNIKQ